MVDVHTLLSVREALEYACALSGLLREVADGDTIEAIASNLLKLIKHVDSVLTPAEPCTEGVDGEVHLPDGAEDLGMMDVDIYRSKVAHWSVTSKVPIRRRTISENKDLSAQPFGTNLDRTTSPNTPLLSCSSTNEPKSFDTIASCLSDAILLSQQLARDLLGLQNRDVQILKTPATLQSKRLRDTQQKPLSPSVLDAVGSQLLEQKFLFCLGLPRALRMTERFRRLEISVSANHSSTHNSPQECSAARGALNPSLFEISAALTQLGLCVFCDDITCPEVRSAGLQGLTILASFGTLHPRLLVLGLRRPGMDGTAASKDSQYVYVYSKKKGQVRKKVPGFRDSTSAVAAANHRDQHPWTPVKGVMRLTCQRCHTSVVRCERQLVVTTPSPRLDDFPEESLGSGGGYQCSACLACGSSTFLPATAVSPFDNVSALEQRNLGETNLFVSCPHDVAFSLPPETLATTPPQFNRIAHHAILQRITPELVMELMQPPLPSDTGVVKTEPKDVSWDVPQHGWLLRSLDDQESVKIRLDAILLLTTALAIDDPRIAELRYVTHLPLLASTQDTDPLIQRAALHAILRMATMAPLKDGAMKKLCRLLHQKSPSLMPFLLCDIFPWCTYSDHNALKVFIKHATSLVTLDVVGPAFLEMGYMIRVNYNTTTTPDDNDDPLSTMTRPSVTLHRVDASHGTPLAAAAAASFADSESERRSFLLVLLAVLRCCCAIGACHKHLLHTFETNESLSALKTSMTENGSTLSRTMTSQDIDSLCQLMMLLGTTAPPTRQMYHQWKLLTSSVHEVLIRYDDRANTV